MLAIIVMLAGVGAIMGLPIAQYPDVAPPQVSVRANYPGANAETLQNSVTQVIEQQLTGIDGLLYFSSSSSSRGSVSISVTFAKGTNPDNRAGPGAESGPAGTAAAAAAGAATGAHGPQIESRFPAGSSVSPIRRIDRRTRTYPTILSRISQDPLGRIKGVGDTNVFGAQYAMRIWLDPSRLASFQLMPSDVVTAIQNQNTEVAAGELGGQPSPPSQYLNATVTAQSRLQTPEQFANIILKTQPSGATVRLKDVARVELGAESYAARSRVNGHPGAGIAVLLAPGADALKTAELVKAIRRGPAIQPARRIPDRLCERFDRLHQIVDRRGRQDADRGGDPRRDRHVCLPCRAGARR